MFRHGFVSAVARVIAGIALCSCAWSATPLLLPGAAAGSFSADGNTIAYVPIEQWQNAWKRYRGGQTTPVWLVNIKTLDVEKIPRKNSNDSSPVWSGTTVYLYGLKGEWEVEGHGIPPDMEVQNLPQEVAAGHDAQLARAVSIVLQQLKEHPVVDPVVPPYPNYHEHDDLGSH